MGRATLLKDLDIEGLEISEFLNDGHLEESAVLAKVTSASCGGCDSCGFCDSCSCSCCS